MGLVGSTFPISAITGIFGEVLLYSVFTSIRSDDSGGAPNKADALAQPLELDSCYPTFSRINPTSKFVIGCDSLPPTPAFT